MIQNSNKKLPSILQYLKSFFKEKKNCKRNGINCKIKRNICKTKGISGHTTKWNEYDRNNILSKVIYNIFLKYIYIICNGIWFNIFFFKKNNSEFWYSNSEMVPLE